MKSVNDDYFEFFGLPRDLAIDPKSLEKIFYSLSRELHPDLFARKSADEREYALEATAVLNDSYRTLRDPLARTMYLLKLEGFDVGEQGSKDVPSDLLEEIFELNMALEDSEPGSPEIAGARRRFEEMREDIDSTMSERFADWDSSHNRESLVELRALLNRRKYISNLIDKTNVPD